MKQTGKERDRNNKKSCSFIKYIVHIHIQGIYCKDREREHQLPVKQAGKAGKELTSRQRRGSGWVLGKDLSPILVCTSLWQCSGVLEMLRKVHKHSPKVRVLQRGGGKESWAVHLSSKSSLSTVSFNYSAAGSAQSKQFIPGNLFLEVFFLNCWGGGKFTNIFLVGAEKQSNPLQGFPTHVHSCNHFL